MRDEQLLETMRFYADLRFKQLTLLVAVMTLVGAGVAQFGDKPLAGGITTTVAACSFALLFTAVSWVIEVRAVMYWEAHREKLAGLWPAPKRTWLSWLNSSNAVALLHVALFGFWLYVAGASRLAPIPFWLSVVIGIGLLLYTGWAYRSHAVHDERLGPPDDSH